MKVMVIDTALGNCLAAMFEAGETVAPLGVRQEQMTKGHQERLGGFARDAVAEAGGFDGLERIGVTVGPGSFTGLRVGLSFALGLGTARGVPVVGLSSLDGLAASVPEVGLVVAAIDARRGQVYVRLFEDGQPLGDAEALAIDTCREKIIAIAKGRDPVIVGSGAAVLAEGFEPLAGAQCHSLMAPLPEALANLTATLDPASNLPAPLYLRAPDATPPSRLPGQPRTAST